MRLVALALLLVACGGKTLSLGPPVGCGDRPTIEGLCVGVADTPICDGDRCTEGVTCRSVIDIANDDQLQRQGAEPGDCLVLAPCSYGNYRLDSGAALLGRGHRQVMLRSITVDARSNALIRGVSATSISARGTALLTLDRVMVEGSAGTAVEVIDGDLVVEQSTIRRGTGAGIVVTCKNSCPIGARQKMTVSTTWVDAQQRIGVWGLGTDMFLRDVVITRIAPHSFLYGRGVEASKRSTLQAAFVRVEVSSDVAFFIHESTGTLGPGLEVTGGNRALHLSAIPGGGVIVDGFRFAGMSVAGIGIDRGSRGVVVRNGTISRTQLLQVPVDIGSQVDVGDGIAWVANSEATIEASVRIDHSARRAAVIHPSAVGTFAATLIGDDASRGIVVRGNSAAEHPGLTIAPGIRVDYSTAAISVPPSSAPP